MNVGELRAHCLSFAGAAKTFPFGPETSVFKVAGKMFAVSQLDQVPLRASLKCEPGLAEQLRETHAAVLPGYHLNKRHWNTVIVDGSLADQLINDMIGTRTTSWSAACLRRAKRRWAGAPTPDLFRRCSGAGADGVSGSCAWYPQPHARSALKA